MKPMFITETPFGPSLPVMARLGQDGYEDYDQLGADYAYEDTDPYGEESRGEETYEEYRGEETEEEETEEESGFDLSDVLGLKDAINSLFSYIPSELLGAYKTEFEGCRRQVESSNWFVAALGVNCLRNLYGKMQQEAEKAGTRPSPPLPRPVGGEFPVIPVAIGAVALTGLGLLLFLPKS